MKKRLIAILAVASIILTSCANEKQKEETNSQFYSVINIEELYEKLFNEQELQVLTLNRK